MNYKEFLVSLEVCAVPPEELTVHLKSLWLDKKGDWHAAHDLIDQLSDLPSARLHAYLHRAEGDLSNASYWYSRAKEPLFEGSLEEEWVSLVKKFLS